MALRRFSIRFTYFDGRNPYSYRLEALKTSEALYRFKTVCERLKQENENGVSRVELKLGNKIVERDDKLAYPSRWYVVREKRGTFFEKEGRPWGVCVPNSPRRLGNYTSEEEARRIADERNAEIIEKVN